MTLCCRLQQLGGDFKKIGLYNLKECKYECVCDNCAGIIMGFVVSMSGSLFISVFNAEKE